MSMTIEMTDHERDQLAEMLKADLHAYGYRDIKEHEGLRIGTRIRHRRERWPEAYTRGTAYVVALTHKPDSAWSREWGMPDVELIALFDKPSLPGHSRLSQLAQYHVSIIEAAI